MNLVYIMAPSYSGSTLLTFLMAEHPRIATIGELKGSSMGDIDAYECSCGDLILNCAFWSQVSQDLAEKNIDFSVRDFNMKLRTDYRLLNKVLNTPIRSSYFEQFRDLVIRFLPGTKKRVQEILDRNLEFMRSATRLTSSEYFLDGSKDPVRCKYFLADSRFNTKVIRLVRDGRGVCRSMMKNDAAEIGGAVQPWRRIMTEVNSMYSLIAEDMRLTVRYEDLCVNPDETMSRIWDFLEIEGQQIGHSVDTGSNHIIGNRMRLSTNSKICLDEKWRTELSQAELDIFDRHGQALNSSFGYR